MYQTLDNFSMKFPKSVELKDFSKHRAFTVVQFDNLHQRNFPTLPSALHKKPSWSFINSGFSRSSQRIIQVGGRRYYIQPLITQKVQQFVVNPSWKQSIGEAV
jgi:hypothetical protein